MQHELKILPQYFKEVQKGNKTFEVRKNDRDYKVGDILILKEYEHFFDMEWKYTGQQITKEISYILHDSKYGIEKGYCILGLKPIGIELKNINLTGLTLVDELEKAEEEEKEFKQALTTFLKDRHGISREHLLEELCDTIQVKLSIAKMIDIDIKEIVSYWNKIHNEKIKSRPRKENCL